MFLCINHEITKIDLQSKFKICYSVNYSNLDMQTKTEIILMQNAEVSS